MMLRGKAVLETALYKTAAPDGAVVSGGSINCTRQAAAASRVYAMLHLAATPRLLLHRRGD
jgi:hypothetical protein